MTLHHGPAAGAVPTTVTLTALLIAALFSVLPVPWYWQAAERASNAVAEKGNEFSNDASAATIPFRELPVLEQMAMVVTGFGVKPFYTALSLLLAIVLWRQTSPDLVALRWAMVCFFVGENFCAANYLFYGDGCIAFEYLHSYGMVLCFALTTFAVLEGVDWRIVKYSDPEAKCAALGLCRRCIKYADAPCGLKNTFMVMIPAMMILCGLPLTAGFSHVAYNTKIFGTPYTFSHAAVYQMYELRYCPLAAVLLFAVALAVLVAKRDNAVLWSKLFFSAAMGALGFSLFRLAFVQLYRDNLAWYSFWEEVTELIFIAGTGLVLWFFREGLFGAGRIPAPRTTEAPAGQPQ